MDIECFPLEKGWNRWWGQPILCCASAVQSANPKKWHCCRSLQLAAVLWISLASEPHTELAAVVSEFRLLSPKA